jgi:hypothetical protein
MKQDAKMIEFSKLHVAIDGSETSITAAECAISLSETTPVRRIRKNWRTQVRRSLRSRIMSLIMK